MGVKNRCTIDGLSYIHGKYIKHGLAYTKESYSKYELLDSAGKMKYAPTVLMLDSCLNDYIKRCPVECHVRCSKVVDFLATV